MARYAVSENYETTTRVGAGLRWFARIEPECAQRLVVVLGTNDLRQIRQHKDAYLYIDRVLDAIVRWRATGQVVWATPGCFVKSRHPQLERGSMLLSQVLREREDIDIVIDDGRRNRCDFHTGDGIHPNGATYREWWNYLRSVGHE